MPYDTIALKYDVIDSIVADINRLADRVLKFTRLDADLSRSKGYTADNVKGSYQLVSLYASILREVMLMTASSIQGAKEAMVAADRAEAQQYTDSSLLDG